MRIGISVKWTLSSVLIVILVVGVYTFILLKDTQRSVDSETERIERIQNNALDELGAQTTKTVSLPASSLMFDNDLEGLKGLLAPIVAHRESSDESYTAVYASIIAPNGRVWVTVAHPRIRSFQMAGKTYYDRDGGDGEAVEIDASYVEKLTKGEQSGIAYEDTQRHVVREDGSVGEVDIRQYAVAIEPKDAAEDEGRDRVQGYLIVGYSTEGLHEVIQQIKADGDARKNAALQYAFTLALVAVFAGIVIACIQAFFVTRNLKLLSKAASQIASGDLSVRSHVQSHDEVGQLGDQFNAMADRVQALMHETEQKAMLEKEVDIARSIQTTLLPPCGFAECGPLQLNGFFQPASECGGDFWSYNRLPDGSVLLTIGDVTGHGVPSAMITACAKSALDTLLSMSMLQQLNLSQIVASLNVAICQTAKRTLFMTFQAVRVSADGRMAEIVNAGHNFPLLVRQGEVKGIVVRGERLGDNPKAHYDSLRFDLMQDDMFLLYTDGVTEYLNASGAEYGEKRLRKVIATLGQCDVNTAMNYFWSDFTQFCADAPQNDDITLLFTKVV